VILYIFRTVSDASMARLSRRRLQRSTDALHTSGAFQWPTSRRAQVCYSWSTLPRCPEELSNMSGCRNVYGTFSGRRPSRRGLASSFTRQLPCLVAGGLCFWRLHLWLCNQAAKCAQYWLLVVVAWRPPNSSILLGRCLVVIEFVLSPHLKKGAV
jgi:hypothetical protein